MSKISKTKVETGSPQKKRMAIKIIQDEDQIMDDNTTPIPEENKEKGI